MTTTVNSNVLCATVFTMQDQERFAQFTGDFNPMHMSVEMSRRTQAGAPAVHGMHQVLWALEQLKRVLPAKKRLTRMRVRFLNFLLVDEAAHVLVLDEFNDVVRLNVAVGEATCTNIVVDLVNSGTAPDNHFLASCAEPNGSPVCRELKFDDIQSASGDLAVQYGHLDARELFPGASLLMGSNQVAALGALSRLVGMECPGANSIFSSANLQFTAISHDNLHFSAIKSERRFSFVRMKVEGGGIEGTIEAFLRTPPVSQPGVAHIRQLISPNEFSHSTALIIGASRGLGEFTAKAIGAGGGRVVATYLMGREECEKIAGEINSFGGFCDILSYDVLKPAARQLHELQTVPTSMYYFATTKIIARQAEVFDPARFQQLAEVYVHGFFDLCLTLRKKGVERLVIFYPSSTAIDSRPAEMGVYAMAKAAGEVLCNELSTRWPNFRVVVKRLPRLLTDQTTTVLNIDAPAVEDILLPIIREIEEGSM